MEFQDKSLNCVDCGTEFIWTAGEQLFFADKNFKNEPKRCKSCKAKRASRPASGGAVARERVETTTNCSACGKETTVAVRLPLKRLVLHPWASRQRYSRQSPSSRPRSSSRQCARCDRRPCSPR